MVIYINDSVCGQCVYCYFNCLELSFPFSPLEYNNNNLSINRDIYLSNTILNVIKLKHT